MTKEDEHYRVIIRNRIEKGLDLSREDLMFILKVLFENPNSFTDDYVKCVMSTKPEIPKRIKGYKMKGSGRKENCYNEELHDRYEKIVIDYDELRKNYSHGESLQILAKESVSRFGIALGSERIKTCITLGRKRLRDIESLEVPF